MSSSIFLCFIILKDPYRPRVFAEGMHANCKFDLNTANDGVSEKASPFHALIGKNDCPCWLVVWPIYLTDHRAVLAFTDRGTDLLGYSNGAFHTHILR